MKTRDQGIWDARMSTMKNIKAAKKKINAYLNANKKNHIQACLAATLTTSLNKTPNRNFKSGSAIRSLGC